MKTPFDNISFKPKTLVDLVRWRAENEPDKIAYSYMKDDKKQVHLSYGELDRRARAIAAFFQQKGLTGERALLLYPPGLEYITGFFGCLYADVIAVPAYPPDPNRLNRSLPRLQAIINDAGATFALSTDSIIYMIRMLKLGSKVSNTLGRMPFLRKFRTTMKYFSSSKQAIAESRELGDLQWFSTDSIPNGLSGEWHHPEINEQSISFLQYTSGSTGNPKGVILTHENLLHNSKVIFNALQYRENTVGVFWLPIYHDMGLIGGVLQPLYSGRPSYLMSPIAFLQRPMRWLEMISNMPKDLTVGTAAPNFAYDLCIKKATPEKVRQLDLSRWLFALSGAEPVRANTIDRFSEVFAPAGFKKEVFFPAYGLAESTLLVTGADPSELPVYLTVDKLALKRNKIIEVPKEDPNGQTLVSSGYIQPEVKTIIVNPDTSLECKPGEIGEIWVKSKSVSKGYYGREKETKETFQNYLADSGDGPYLRTGDMGFIKDNNLFVTGRVKDLIIIRGTNHYPQDIEFTVENAHPEIRQGCTAAFTVEDRGTEELVIVAEIRHSKNVDFNEIIQAIREAVTANHDLQTRSVVLIKARSINKTSSGKIQRRATKADFQENRLAEVARWDAGEGELMPAVKEEVKPTEVETPAKPTATKDEQAAEIERWIVHQLSESLNVPEEQIDVRQPFISFGLDSAQAVGLAGDLEEWLGRSLPPTLIWDYPTIESLAAYLASEEVAVHTKPRVRVVSEYEPIAIVGIGARFPGANNTDEFWNMLKNGLEGIREVPANRWDADKYYDPEPGKPGKMITKNGGFLDQVDQFDAEFFGISPREAVHIDPQQRLLLEVSWDALENAGIPLEKLSGTRTGVFVGISANDYSRLQKGGLEKINPYSGTGNAFSIAANRISYIYDLHGPSLSLDTACSSSLVAVHEACQSLRSGDCDMAMAGGVNLILSPELTITFSQARMMSADGRCKTFDSSADGYGRGEGAGMVILKRLQDAVRDKDRIIAVIRGSAVNQDGRSNGITAPNGLAQQQVINEALDNAGVSPDEIQYIETHGTGTPLGDPIEMESIKKTLMQERSKDNTLFVGSVKTNIGHLESAAGIAGLIKTALALEKEEIPPHINFKELNPHIKLDGTPIKIATENIPWPRGKKKRLAGISAFGFGGTNAHVILEEAPEQAPVHIAQDEAEQHEKLLVFTAHNESALYQMEKIYHHFVRNQLEDSPKALYQLGYNLSRRRTHLDNRLIVVASDKNDLEQKLSALSNHEEAPFTAAGIKDANFRPKVAFVFSGQGPQWWAMGRELMKKEPIFRATIERISFLLQEYTGWSLVEELNKDEASSRMDQTEVAQPALFAIQTALAALWRTWGVVPDGLIGHSVGEVAAAHLSGILSLENAVKVIYHRSRLMQQATGLGKMAAVDLPLEDLREITKGLEDQLSIGAHNSHTSHVLSGKEEAIDAVLAKLAERPDVFAKKLSVNYAFHSPQMEPFRQELSSALEGLELQKMNIPLISTVTAGLAQENDYGPEYWGRNVREPVQFSESIDRLIEDGYNVFVEIGPHPVLKNYIRQNLEAARKQALIFPSLRRKEPEKATMLFTLGRLFIAGYPVAFEKLYDKFAAHMDLPPYPFQREHYWIDEEPEEKKETVDYVHPLLGNQLSNSVLPENSSWKVQLRSDYVAYLNQGRKDALATLPEAAYLEMALAASRQHFPNAKPTLQNIVFKNMLNITEGDIKELHFSLSPISGSKAYFQAQSKRRLSTGKSEWLVHSLGSIISQPHDESAIPTVSLDELKAEMKELSPGELPEEFSRLMNKHQHAMQQQQLWSSDHQMLVKFNYQNSDISDWDTYHIHPIVLNTTFLLLSASAQRGRRYPFLYRAKSLDRFEFYRKPQKEFYAHIEFSDDSSNSAVLTSTISLLDPDGKTLLRAQNLRLQAVPLSEAIANLLYQVEWHKESISFGSLYDYPTNWLIIGENNGRAALLSGRLEQKKLNVIHLLEGSKSQLNDNGRGTLAFNSDDASSFLDQVLDKEFALVFFADTENDQAVERLNRLIGALQNVSHKPNHFWLITERAVQLPGDSLPAKPCSAAAWDQGLQIRLSNPEMRFSMIDLDEDVLPVFNYLFLPVNEQIVAVRGEHLYVPRLRRAQLAHQTASLIDPLQALSERRKSPQADEIEIEVQAVGINPIDYQRNTPVLSNGFGYECAGKVVSVGENVTDFKPGDQVLALAKGAFQKYVTTPAQLVIRKPKELKPEQGAAVPLGYLTAHYALSYLARLSKDETVLILNADTPEGLAAVAVAKGLGARIFATTHRWINAPLLSRMGVENVFKGDTLDFIDQTNQRTDGLGVDVIVNTGKNGHVSASFSVLKEFGRFIELNSFDLFEQPIVYHNLRRNISFFAIDMVQMLEDQQALVQRLFREVGEAVDSGKYELVPVEIAQVNQIPLLLRQLEKHLKINKPVVLLKSKSKGKRSTSGLFDSSANYLVAGTVTENDLALLRWMHANGAKNVRYILLNPKDQNKHIPALEDVELNIKYINSSDPEDFQNIKGVLINTGSLPATTPFAQIREALENIYRNLAEKDTDFFITLSSFDLLFKEAFSRNVLRLDHLLMALNQQRIRDGLSALHVQLGGATPARQEIAIQRWNVLIELIFQRQGHFIITETNWQSVAERLSPDRIPGLYHDLILEYIGDGSGKDAGAKFEEITRADLVASAPNDRANLLEQYLLHELAAVLKVPPQKIRKDQPLTTLGIDSLMAIELKNTVESKLGVQLPIATLLKGPTIQDLRDEFLPQFDEAEGEQAAREEKRTAIHDTEIREFELSYGQQAMFFQHMMNPDSIFNLAYAVRIRSSFDREIMRQSFQTLIDRHPSLRTTFHLKDGQPIQRIHPRMDVFFIEEDARNWSDAELRARMDQEVLSHFDLEAGPLMRIFLFQRSENDSVLLFVMHHIVTDIWSQAVLLDELSQIFAANGSDEQLPPVVYDYTDFVKWQKELLSGKSEARLFDYWKNKLSGELPYLNIPTDRPRPPVQTFKGSTETIWFPEQLSGRVHQFCERNGITVFTFLLAAYYVLLHKYTSQDDIIVGSPTAGRSKREFERTIGYFVNPVPFRANLRGNPTFDRFLEQVKQTVLEAFENMDYPLNLLVEKLQPERDVSRTPLFQTMFILQRAHLMHDQGLSKFALSREGATLSLGGLTIESMNLEQGVAPFDLTMMAVESGDGLAASLGYNIDLFDASTVQRMLNHYIQLIESIIEQPQAPVSNLNLLSEPERKRLLIEWNQTAFTPDNLQCVHELITRNAEKHPDKTALIFEQREVSYAELNRKANQVANYLVSLNLKPEAIVGVLLDRSPEMIFAILGALKAGCAYLPLDPTYPTERLHHMVTDSGLRYVITDSALVGKISGLEKTPILIDDADSPVWSVPDDEPDVPVSLDQLAYIIYTSGSTGKPKGTLLHHKGLANVLYSTRKNYRVSEQSRTLQFASFSFDASVEEIFSTLTAGGTLVLATKDTLLSLGELIQLIRSREISNITLPPSVLRVLQPEDFPTLQSVVSAGEKCPAEIAAKWSKGRNFVNGYGPTEATICTTAYPVPEDFNGHTVPIGKPVGNVRLYILDRFMNPVPVGVPGELYIAGVGLARGYLNRPELTAEKFVPNPFADANTAGERLYRTGDLVRYLPDGNLEFLSRVDFQVKIRGFRIELGEIESVLSEHPGVKEAAVIARPAAGEYRLIAYYIPAGKQETSGSELKNFLMDRLPDYMVPAAFVPLSEFPLTANGKLDHKKLPDPEAQHSGRQFVAPGTEIEQKLAAIWKEVLHLDDIGANDNFFELGGHSLGIVQVQAKIKEVFDRELNVVDMFKYPTIKAMAGFLGDQTSTKEKIEKSQSRAAKRREATRIQQQRMQQRRKRK